MIGIVPAVDQAVIELEDLLLSVAVLPVTYVVVRTYVRRITAAESQRLEQVVGEIARLTTRSGGPGEPAEPS